MNKSISRSLAMAALSMIGMGAAVMPNSNDVQPRELSASSVTNAASPATGISRTARSEITAAWARAIGMGNYRQTRYPNGPGWTHAHVGRMARKRRNKVKHRKASRG